jgi:translation initiation factor eIF-2B subunit epsilon
LVIDKKAVDRSSDYLYKMLNTYIEKTSSVSITSTVSNDCVIGAKTEVNDHCNITQSCIGANCKIGKNVVIVNSLIDSHVTIGDNVQIRNAIIQNNSILKKGCAVSKGAIITSHVVVKEGAVIPEGAVCSELTFDSGEEQFVTTTEVDSKYFEKGVIAYLPRDMILKTSELICEKAYE